MQKNKIIFDLIANIICDKKITLDKLSESDLEYIWEISKRHDVAHIVSSALEKLPSSNDSPLIPKFNKKQMMAVYRSVQTEYELNTLVDILEKESIDFIPLKGSVLRSYYPEAWLRTSCDIDILVKNKDLDRAVKLLVEKHGYTFEERGLHDVSLFSKNKTHLELHFDLTSEDRYVPSLSTVWDHCTLSEGKSHHYLMSHEFFLFYHLTHMAEHFVHGGCGIRPLIDLWIIRQKMGYEESSVLSLLEQVGLQEFYHHMKDLSSVWFEDAPHTELTAETEAFIIGSGIYGTMENNIAMKQGEDKKTGSYIFGRIFLPYEKLKRLYPRVERHKILVPFYQVKRWFTFLFKKDKKRAGQEIKVSATISHEKIESVTGLCKALGLK